MAFGVDSIGYNPYANDSAFLYALNSYNPHFKGTQSSQYAQYLQAAQQAAAPQDTTATTPKIDPTFKGSAYGSAKSDDGPGIGTALAVAGGAAALIYAGYKGKGNPIEGVKQIWNSLKSKGAKAVEEVAAKTKSTTKSKATEGLKEIKVVMKGGKPVYYVPGKTTTTGVPSEITNALRSNKELNRLTGLRFNTGETTIKNATFTLKDGGNSNTIEFVGDKIIKITNGSGADITSLFVNGGKLRTDLNVADTTFASKIEECIAKIKAGDKGLIFDNEYALSNITYTTKIGDNVAEVFRNGISTKVGKPTIKKLTTLKECKADSDEVLAYVRKSKADGNDISSIVGSDFTVKKILPGGYKVGEFDLKDSGNLIHIVNGKPESVTICGKKYLSNSDRFLAYMERYEKAVNTMIENALKDSKIPDGATIIPV